MGMFEEAYQQLNAAQKKAVDHIDGPVLVVAGPGTGKTQLLSMRVANILRKTDVDSGNILCLTFTNKAALNMRERLLTLTDGAARDVVVKTFHSFAAEIMNMYPDYFWNGARLSTAPDWTQNEIIQDILASLPLSDPLALRFAGNFTAGRDVKNALKYAKEAGLTPEKLQAIITANLAYIDSIEAELCEILSAPLRAKALPELVRRIEALPNQGLQTNLEPLQDLGQVIKDSLHEAVRKDEGTGKTKHTGTWKQRWVQSVEGSKAIHKERERNKWWLSLAGVYQSYRSQLHQRGYYDYSDMIVEVITQLEQHAGMRADAQERFQYVLIDEFQDTNAAQLRLAHLIADHESNDNKPNIMAVGDDDQSIYKFNGAELSNMLSFKRSYTDTEIIVLTDNYRSSQAILETSAKIIEPVQDRLVNREPGISKDLQAQKPPSQAGELLHLRYATEEYELSGVAERIAKEYAAGNHSITVLARDHASLRRMASLLHAANVPVAYDQQSNILDHSAIRQIYAIGQCIIAIQQGNSDQLNAWLSTVLRAPMWNISAEVLWELASKTYPHKSWFEYMLQSDDEQLSSIANWLLWLSQQASQEPLPIVLEYVLGLRASQNITSPMRQYYLDTSEKKIDSEYLLTLSAVRLLETLAHDFARGPQATLADFVRFMQLSYETDEIIADESCFVTGDNAVELLTVHKAKGLEFDTVYIINAVDAHWRPNAGGRKCPANLPLQPVGDDLDDFARLMYVAATRAKRTLIAASYQQDTTGKEVLATPLLADVLPVVDADSEVSDRPVAVLEQHLAWPRLNVSNELLNLRGRLETFSLSASALLNFLDLTTGGPANFLETNLLSLPSPTNSSMAFGNAMHSALEYAQIAVNADALHTKKVLQQFEKALAQQQLPKNEEARFNIHGQDLLTKLLASDTFWIGKGGLPEQKLSDVRIGQARVNGTLDRIDQKDTVITIVDYKTGKPLSSLTTRDQSKVTKAWRHRTQLIFYAMLLKNSSRFKAQEVKGQLWYLEASASKELIREYNPSTEEIDELEALITVIWPKIMTLNLPDTTNYSADYSGITTFIEDLLTKKI
ncbi:ATP-dependent helicase [Candidatus Saccharibacteria bacterium]|nr:MAG: ATP-dependent helicase [Candidatus Saccharibacteria bacterium]